MKKHYEKMCMTPLGFVSECNLLEGSVVSNMTLQSTGQEVKDYDFSQDTSFNTEWE